MAIKHKSQEEKMYTDEQGKVQMEDLIEQAKRGLQSRVAILRRNGKGDISLIQIVPTGTISGYCGGVGCCVPSTGKPGGYNALFSETRTDIDVQSGEKKDCEPIGKNSNVITELQPRFEYVIGDGNIRERLQEMGVEYRLE